MLINHHALQLSWFFLVGFLHVTIGYLITSHVVCFRTPIIPNNFIGLLGVHLCFSISSSKAIKNIALMIYTKRALLCMKRFILNQLLEKMDAYTIIPLLWLLGIFHSQHGYKNENKI